MIKAVLIINVHGIPRFTKFYQHFPEQKQQRIIKEIYQSISGRDDDVCNFLEAGSLVEGTDYKLIYRHYATLYFVFCVDTSESELGILDLIQVFVETLDKCFQNVCELDLVFNVDKVHSILNEFIVGGLVVDPSVQDVVATYKEQCELEKKEIPVFYHETH